MPPSVTALQALLNGALAAHRAGRLDEAERGYRQILALQPRHAPALNLLGVALSQRGDAARGAELIAEAARVAPRDPAIRNNLGNALKALGRLDEAAAAFRETLRLKPDYPEGHFNLGNCLNALGRRDEAIAAFRRAVALKADYGEARHNLAQALLNAGHWSEAHAAAQRAAALKPNDCEVLEQAAYIANHLCDWRNRAARDARLLDMARRPESRIHPFMLLAASDDPALHQTAARNYLRNSLAVPAATPPKPQRRDRLRVAYLSADFCDHATANLMAGLFECHDRATQETIAISWSPRDGSQMEQRLRKAFDRFIDVHDLDDDAVAALIRELGVDIAVDLKGYTRDARPGILARRPAAVQVAYIGYPGTLGAGFIDYAVVDETVVPADQQPFYDERLVWLSGSYQVNDRTRVGAPPPSRAECGLPEDAFLFCSFNASYKITPETFDLWCRILHRAEGSALWLLASRDGVAENLRREAAARGIDPARLIFAKPVPVAAHLARLALADLMLDNLPYNAHTTASDALWVGLPLLTCPGRSFAARVAASLLTTSGFPELIAGDLEEFEAKAAAFAANPAAIAAIRRRLQGARETNPLFDTPAFARRLETAYRRMRDIALAGEPPRAFHA